MSPRINPDDLAAAVARLAVLSATGALEWLPESVVEELTELHEQLLDAEQWAASSDAVERQRATARRLHAEGAVVEALALIAHAYQTWPGRALCNQPHAALTLPGGTTLSVAIHPATTWMLEMFGPLAPHWLHYHGAVRTVVWQ